MRSRVLLLSTVAVLALAGPATAAGSVTFVGTGDLVAGPRASHEAVLLLDGRAFVVGGYGRADGAALKSAEAYDVANGTWSLVGEMSVGRSTHQATRLGDGSVLVTGGADSGTSHASVERWTPSTGTFAYVAPMSAPRFSHRATLLADGRVLVTGGNASTVTPVATATAEVYDPTSDTWVAVGPMTTPRQQHAQVRLADGRVLVAGGDRGSANGYVGVVTCEVFDPATGTFSPTGSMATPRAAFALAALFDGRVLAIGGNSNATGSPVHAAEVYDPATGSWTSVGTAGPGGNHPSIAPLPDGRVLLVGGQDLGIAATTAAALFDPASDAFEVLAPMATPRFAATATTLGDGSVVVAGGYHQPLTFPYWTASCERFVVSAPNLPPTAIAGDDQAVHVGDVVALDGRGSSDDNTPDGDLEFVWTIVTRPAGSVAALSDATSATPSFTTDLAGTYVVSLVVTDGDGLPSAADTVTVSSVNVPPSVDAGPDRAGAVGESVALDGVVSDPDGDPFTVVWTVRSAPVGSTAMPVGSTSVSATFTPDEPGTYVLELEATDAFGASSVDTAEVTATPTRTAEDLLCEASRLLCDLPRSAFASPGLRVAACVELRLVLVALAWADAGHAHARDVARAVLARLIDRTDGVPERGAVDVRGPGKDWILDVIAQEELYDLLTAAYVLL